MRSHAQVLELVLATVEAPADLPQGAQGVGAAELAEQPGAHPFSTPVWTRVDANRFIREILQGVRGSPTLHR